ncbi:uncharacterized protein FIBRA_08184 [Fibroporia radiculosa]|uniref:OTU domain-containing protein n=1 Tax=Fibroporia radiculosa TaxID=599839 RepID=J4GWC7_9APHY|nr:uncharacterized protein FIBRA_08184 [Fibroporia radiculosa]CCM05945.1 predicted protein [Fibroporia radiculosa]
MKNVNQLVVDRAPATSRLYRNSKHMGSSKRKSAKPPPQLRSRTTRSRGKALTDPAENSQLLTEQLRAMGLYAAPTLGDGNCLFRALCDQLYGTPSYHLRLRQDICNWIESHSQRYEPFVDDERGLSVHLQCMRQPATYGGHLELSAFAHMTRRDVKVIQPGLVYVIEWAAGGDPASDPPATGDGHPSSSSSTAAPAADDSALNDREKRRLARERKRAERERDQAPQSPQMSEQNDPPGPVYVAYHDWEHFSSIRNLRGPHTGFPNVIEAVASDRGSSSPVTAVKKKPVSKARIKPESKRLAAKTRASAIVEVVASAPRTPSQVPLPVSRSPSPVPITSRASPLPPQTLVSGSASLDLSRSYRSPKRTFDESSASSLAHSEDSQGAAKRAKGSSRALQDTAHEEVLPVVPPSALQAADMQVDEEDIDTPDLSVSGSSTESTSSLSSVPSPIISPAPSPAPIPVSTSPPASVERRLTRRQRKALGLPRPRAALVASAAAKTRNSAGKIVIPGGRCKKPAGEPTTEPYGEDGDDEAASAEWRRNGTGRVDVRGFRELKI